MSKTINNSTGADTLVKGLASLRSFAFAQEVVSTIMVVMSFMMMLSSGINLVIGVVFLGLVLGIILRLLHVSENLSGAIDSFRKYSYKQFELSYHFLMPIMKNKKFKTFLVVFFMVSFLTVIALFLVRGVGMAVISLLVVLEILLLILATYHAGILTFLRGLGDALDASVFQLASILIAVPFCTNLIPGIIALFAWIISQFVPVELSISLFSVWSQIAGFFVANLVAWLLVGQGIAPLMEELGKGEGSGLIVESCGAGGVV